ncbi:MAG TPA: amidase [Acidobacteria bacterium]|nr:amidase [Acidobacteriota bacterium]
MSEVDRQLDRTLTDISYRTRKGEVHEHLESLELLFAENEPLVQAFVPEKGRFARLHREAEALLTEYPDSNLRPYLFGVPIGIKDVFHVEGLPTTAGSRLPPEVLQGREGAAVSSLRRKGALFLGKTVSTEFAYFAPGPTRNPQHVDHTPGGSSSGSAAAVAAGLCPVALGTQTIGSVIRPAAYCGVIGFKPSFGRITADGFIPLAPSLDHVGLFTTDVESVSVACMMLCDDWFPGVPFGWPVLGVPEGPYLENMSEEGLAQFRETCDWLSSRFRIKQVPVMADFATIAERHLRLTAAEAAEVHAPWFAAHRHLYAPQTIELIERGQKVSATQARNDRSGRARLRKQLTEAMEKHGVDLWISPSAPGPAPHGLASTGNPVMNIPWTQAGLPTLTVPAGENKDGLPYGLQISGGFWTDPDLIEWSKEIARVAVL